MIHEEIVEFGKKLKESEIVKEVDIRVILKDKTRILWSSLNEN